MIKIQGKEASKPLCQRPLKFYGPEAFETKLDSTGVDKWTDGRIDGSMDRWIDGSMDRWIDGSMDRWIDG
jgi:hypothetical protein